VLHRVDAPEDEIGQGLLAECVDGHPGPGGVGRFDAPADGHGRPQGGQVAGGTVDPVPHDLHPPIAGGGLAGHLGREVVGFDFDTDAVAVTLGPGDVAAGPDDAGCVVLLVEEAGVGW
jgi:hypothetical protein